MKVAFRKIRLSEENQQMLTRINAIIREYQRQNMKLTLRQLYYQLVSRNVIPNKDTEYKKLSKVLVEGRMAGIVDWGAIEDRLRQAEKPSSWRSPASGIDSLIGQYERPRMDGQDNYIEVWVEKDALSGVLSIVTEKYHVPILVNRGYSSASAIFDSYNRFKKAFRSGQKIIILYLGDHDPSGMDMIRDVTERPLEMLLAQHDDFRDEYDRWVEKEFDGDETAAYDDLSNEFQDIHEHPDCFELEDPDDKKSQMYFITTKAFLKRNFTVQHIALTREQIKLYNPPPNPAKRTDPRAKEFIKKHGSQSWEVDALRPEILNDLLEKAILNNISLETYEAELEKEKTDIQQLEDLKQYLPDTPSDDDDDN